MQRSNPEGNAVFRPPAALQTESLPQSGQVDPTASAAATPTRLEPTATPNCTNLLTFLDDLSIPDGSQVSPGSSLDKRWLVENSGTCNWDDRYSMRLIAGSALGEEGELRLYPARGGTQATLRIIFTAPQEPGTYRSAWQAYSPAGEPFGSPFYIEFNVP